MGATLQHVKAPRAQKLANGLGVLTGAVLSLREIAFLPLMTLCDQRSGLAAQIPPLDRRRLGFVRTGRDIGSRTFQSRASPPSQRWWRRSPIHRLSFILEFAAFLGPGHAPELGGRQELGQITKKGGGY